MYLTQGLHRHVQQRPDEIATVCAGRTRTHAESVDRIARLAAEERPLGDDPPEALGGQERPGGVK